jgi:hypothetical protein
LLISAISCGKESGVIAASTGHNNTNAGSNVSPYAQRFGEATQELIGDGPIKQRLAAAYTDHLAELAEADLPATLRPEFDELQAAMTRVPPAGNETRVRASVQKMSPAEAVAHAATILKLYLELATSTERAEPLKVVPPRKPPRFLTGRP